MKRYILSISILSIFLLTGCWDQSELNQNAIVTGIAIDKGDDFKYKLSIESTSATELNPKTAQGLAPAIVYTIEGDTIGEITHKFNIAVSTHLVFSHMRLLIIGEEVAKEGILSFMDYFDRDREIRDDFNIVVARDTEAVDFLRITNDYQKVSSLKIFPQLDHMLDEWGGTPGIKLNDFIRTYASQGQVPVLSAMKIQGDKEKGGNMDNLKTTTPGAVAKIDSLAIFKYGKLQGYLDLYDTRILLWIQNKLERTALTVPYNEKKFFALRIIHSKTKIKARQVNGRPQIDISVYAESTLDGSDKAIKVTKVKAFEEFENLTNRYLEKEFNQLIEKMQKEYVADIFGLGEIFRDQDYKHFKQYEDNWDVGFKEAKINVHVNVEIKRSGFRNNSYDVN
ncbi:MAG: Ger(x)C family spore germination protein [Niallia nealsonii]|uniref:Ger(x)C family spore germination protein n=1 Tax=Niallia alba TaxID=2729105 RepID=UPI0003328FEF|nr:Ger(x)C family spore germination protein [Niallia alba]EOR27066.1 Ger(x)C family germination protein [Niallia nealsonii AAU1]MDU1845905.1 Ger(x)C family spore germination protein [Niallia nealsonii]MED3794062.1 Ger(x)C family spore germination protein [Niallia alba]